VKIKEIERKGTERKGEKRRVEKGKEMGIRT
jgi:hypothetical protein